MGIQSLQKFIEANCPNACVPVDLLKIARTVAVRRVGVGRGARQQFMYNRLCLVVDGECCLDRLYGGYFSDWVCGGQWNRMVQFLSVLIQTIQHNNIDLAVFFNGGLEPQRVDEWIKQQQGDRKKVNQVLKHVATKATPPPKVWWIPPVCLRTCLRMALRHLNVTVVCTMDDHHQEVIAFCRENGFHGLMAEDAEYAIFDPPRYFSSEQLKLTYKGSLETREFILDEVARSLNLHPNRFCIFAALLGNYLLTEEDLAPFHRTLCPEYKGKVIPSDTLIQAVVNFVRGLPAIDNLDGIGAQVFGATSQEKIQKFKHCVQYYLNGTKDGYLRYRPTMQGRRHEPGCYPTYKNLAPINENTTQQKPAVNGKLEQPPANQENESTPDEEHFPQPGPEVGKFASETAERELSSLTAYQQATGAYNSSGNSAPEIIIDSPNLNSPVDSNLECKVLLKKKPENDIVNSTTTDGQTTNSSKPSSGCHVNGGLLLSSSTSSSSSNSSPNRLSPEATWSNSQKKEVPKLPKVPPEVMRTASERHQKGLMSPWIYQLLSQGEIKIPVAIEDEIPRDLPVGSLLYRPMRQMVYAIIFNLHHLTYMARQKKETEGKDEKVSDIIIKEWVWSKQNQFHSSDHVPAVLLGWPVPTVQRLWFGPSMDDKKCRLRAFLTCMRSDVPLMLNTSYVPQHLLVMCCVLRYIMSEYERPILRKQELDAFLAQAISPQLMNAQYTQNMQLPIVSTRGSQLAALFLQGVENALFANDACGAPVPWLMCCPWLFFDGKLFHHKLLKANSAKSLIEVCDGQIDQVAKVERMRTAILEGLQVEFARPPLPPMGRPSFPVPGFRGSMPPGPPPLIPGGAPLPGRGRSGGRGIIPAYHEGPPMEQDHKNRRRGMIARGGQLEIAGVVVGSWGANYGQIPRARNFNLPPQVTSVGGVHRNSGLPSGLPRGFVPQRRPVVTRLCRPGMNFNQFNKKNKKKIVTKPGKEKSSDESNSSPKGGRGRGCTIETSDHQTIEVNQLATSSDSTSGKFANADCGDGQGESSPAQMNSPIYNAGANGKGDHYS